MFTSFSAFSAEACAILDAFCWSRQHLQVCHFSSLLILSSPPCPLLHLSFYLKLCGRSGRNCLLSSGLSDCNGSPDTSFSWGISRLMSWPDRECYLHPCRSLVVSPFTSRIHLFPFSDWRCTVSSKFFDTQVPSISTKEVVFSCHACCVLSRLCCNGHSLLLSYLSKISRIENSSCSVCRHSPQDTSHFILHCPAMDSAPLTLW